MLSFPLGFIDNILGFRGGALDLILFYYLKRVIKTVNAQFGLLLVFEKDEKVTYMANVGEFTERVGVRERVKDRSDILPRVLKTMEPYVTNDADNDPDYISFIKEEIGSEIEYPFFLRDGRKAVLILLSKSKNHFKEEHLKEIKKIVTELSSVTEEAEKGLIKRGVILYECDYFRGLLEEILGSEFQVFPTTKLEDISLVSKEYHIEFFFKKCNLRCSERCKDIFFISKGTFLPISIVRPFSFNYTKCNSFSCSFYCPVSLSPVQERIVDLVKESKYYTASEKWQHQNTLSLHIAFIQKYIIEGELRDINVQNLSKQFNLSLSYLSRGFHRITGLSLRGYIHKIRMCNSLFYLVNEKTIRHVASRVGYKDRFSFSKGFKKNFGIAPSQVQRIK